MTQKDKFQQMKDTDINTVSKHELTDISEVKIDCNAPYIDRLISFYNQMKNPFCFVCEGVIVKMNYDDNGKSLDETLVEHFSKYKN